MQCGKNRLTERGRCTRGRGWPSVSFSSLPCSWPLLLLREATNHPAGFGRVIQPPLRRASLARTHTHTSRSLNFLIFFPCKCLPRAWCSQEMHRTPKSQRSTPKIPRMSGEESNEDRENVLCSLSVGTNLGCHSKYGIPLDLIARLGPQRYGKNGRGREVARREPILVDQHDCGPFGETGTVVWIRECTTRNVSGAKRRVGSSRRERHMRACEGPNRKHVGKLARPWILSWRSMRA